MATKGVGNAARVVACALAMAMAILLMLPARAHAAEDSAIATTNLTIHAYPAGGMPTKVVEPTYNFKADTWLRVHYDVGMEWQLMWYDGVGNLVPAPGYSWSSESTEFSGLLPGTTYVVRSRLKNGDPNDVEDLTVITYKVPDPPLVVETGVNWGPQEGVLTASDDSATPVGTAWLRMAGNENAGQTDPITDEGKSYEFSLDGENWQKDPLFTGLEPGAEYTVYARVLAGTIASEPTVVRMPSLRDDTPNPGEDPVPGDEPGPGVDNGDDGTDKNQHLSLDQGSYPQADPATIDPANGTSNAEETTGPFGLPITGPLAQTGDVVPLRLIMAIAAAGMALVGVALLLRRRKHTP